WAVAAVCAGLLVLVDRVGLQLDGAEIAAAVDGRAELVDGRSGHSAGGPDPAVDRGVFGRGARPVFGGAVVLADLRAGAAGVPARAGLRGEAGCGADRSSRPAAARVRRVLGAGARPGGGVQHRPGLPAGSAAVLVRARPSRRWS